jgi:hypothetical protein
MKRNTCPWVVFVTLCLALAGAAHAQTLCESVDACGLVWTTGGNAVWTGQTTKTHDGVDAARSGLIEDRRESWMQTTLAGPGTLTFWWSVSSELGYDYLEFYLNGVLQSGRISGIVDWQQSTFNLDTGNQTLRWRYVKDDYASSGQDRGWVDMVNFVPSDQLYVQPGGSLISSGFIGGPFNPSNTVYSLTNTTTTDLDWSAGADQAWVTVIPSGGSLMAGASTNATVLINANAQSLGYWAQTATVTFTNLTDGVSRTRSVNVTVYNASPATRYVNLSNPTPAAPYTNWTTAATNIHDAVDMSVAGDLILVTNGVYQTGARALYAMSNRVAVTKPVTVRSVNGPEVTSIVGYKLPDTNNGVAAVRCVYLTNGAVLSGFTLTNGATRQGGDYRTYTGGGVWCESVSAVVSNCVLSGNTANDYGGGAYSGTLNNCILTGNSAGQGGGAALGTLNNCTLTGNSAGYQGGGATRCTLNNCIVYYNTAAFGYANHDAGYPPSSITLNYCCTTPIPFSQYGTGNIGGEPLFVNTNGWSNLRLQSNSPCINAGNNAYAMTTTDFDGLPRISGGTVDMGAYEFQSVDPFHQWLAQYGLPANGSADYVDSDLDGHNNWQEWVAGTNPTNPVSVLRLGLPLVTPGDVMLTWTSVTNRFYTLESATNLNSAPAFSVLKSNLTGLPGTTSWTDTNHPAAGPRYYRVRVEN